MWKEIEKESVKYRVSGHETVIVRADGKNFSELTKKHFKQPLDEKFAQYMQKVAIKLIEFTQGAVLIYSQSDEFNILLHPPRKQSQIAFGGKVQKIISITAAKASIEFTKILGDEALFDARIILPSIYAEKNNTTLEEAVSEYFKWRFFDGIRNSRNKFARYYLGPKNIEGKTSKQLIEEVEKEKGISWYDLPDEVKYGFVVYRRENVSTAVPKNFDELKKIIAETLKHRE